MFLVTALLSFPALLSHHQVSDQQSLNLHFNRLRSFRGGRARDTGRVFVGSGCGDNVCWRWRGTSARAGGTAAHLADQVRRRSGTFPASDRPRALVREVCATMGQVRGRVPIPGDIMSPRTAGGSPLSRATRCLKHAGSWPSPRGVRVGGSCTACPGPPLPGRMHRRWGHSHLAHGLCPLRLCHSAQP